MNSLMTKNEQLIIRMGDIAVHIKKKQNKVLKNIKKNPHIETGISLFLKSFKDFNITKEKKICSKNSSPTSS